MDAELARAFDADLGREIGEPFERLDELRAAVRVAAVVETYTMPV
jgi:hypothetical protein